MADGPVSPPVVRDLADAHRRLVARSRRTPERSAAAVLNLGAAVLLHGAIERSVLFAQHPLIDDEVKRQLVVEHERLAEDLELLESLGTADSESPDLLPLASALLVRLKAHVARDERLFYRALRLSRPVVADLELPTR